MTYLRGRFGKPAARTVTDYAASLPFDRRLYKQDIAGSIAHARMLGSRDIIKQTEAKQIIEGLETVRGEIEQEKFVFKNEYEDIHMAVEARLIDLIGDTGRKLHTARSRNDQIATDIRLFTMDAIFDTVAALTRLQAALLDVAEANRKVVIPGYTHLQVAQPVLLAHHLLAYFEMLQRDVERFIDCYERADTLPLGSGALAGVPYAIDREAVAEELGFSCVSANSLDAVSDRDFIIEYEAAAATCMMHLSRLAEEIIVWSSAEFGFIEVDDAYAHGSSIMPQKKNPDVAELARGKTGRVYGSLMALLTTMKGLPLAYNSDLQEDKEGFFDCVDTLLDTLDIFAGMVATLTVRPRRTRQAAGYGYILATDLADYLVGKGAPFRTAHDAVARLVGYAVENKKELKDLTLKEYREFSPLFGEDVKKISLKTSLSARNVPGGTAPRQVAVALRRARKLLETEE
jgi:argininosuccinate lyase